MHPVVEEIVKQLEPYKPEKIILFGSYAYGNPGPDSDVDIAIVKRSEKSFRERCIEATLLLRTTTPVDVFVFTPEEVERLKNSNPMIREISEHGKVIYG